MSIWKNPYHNTLVATFYDFGAWSCVDCRELLHIVPGDDGPQMIECPKCLKTKFVEDLPRIAKEPK